MMMMIRVVDNPSPNVSNFYCGQKDIQCLWNMQVTEAIGDRPTESFSKPWQIPVPSSGLIHEWT